MSRAERRCSLVTPRCMRRSTISAAKPLTALWSSVQKRLPVALQ
jgi:hypothetical protein